MINYQSFQILVPPFSMLLDDCHDGHAASDGNRWQLLGGPFYVETKQLWRCVVRGRAWCLVEFGCAVFLGAHFNPTNPLYTNQNAAIGWTPCDRNAQFFVGEIQFGKAEKVDVGLLLRPKREEMQMWCVITYNHHNPLQDSILLCDLTKNGHRGTPCNTEWCKKTMKFAAQLACLSEYMRQLAKPQVVLKWFKVANWVQIGSKDRIRGIAFGMNTQIISEQVV